MKDIITMEREYQIEFGDWARSYFLNNSCVDFPNLTWFVRNTSKALKEITNDGKPIVVGLCGNAGTGKDSATEFLLRYYSLRCTKFALADPIREIGKIFGFTMKQMTDRVLKEKNDDFWKVSPRYFMQRVGTEMFRKQWRDDVWIELARKKVIDLSLPYKVAGGIGERDVYGYMRIIFISDIRFPNEAEFVKSVGGIVVKIHRDGFSKTGDNLHDSEKFISTIKHDVLIRNDCGAAIEWPWKFTTNLINFLSKKSPYNGMDDRGKFKENINTNIF